MAIVTNNIIYDELISILKDMDYFNLYPSDTEFYNYIHGGASHGDIIRKILSNQRVQQEIFPNWAENKDKLSDPVAEYKSLRVNPRWPKKT